MHAGWLFALPSLFVIRFGNIVCANKQHNNYVKIMCCFGVGYDAPHIAVNFCCVTFKRDKCDREKHFFKQIHRFTASDFMALLF